MNALLSLFTNPWILAFLPIAAVPVLLHLWNRRRYREAPWAAMEYLLAALQKSSRRMRIEQLILLLIRTAVVLLVVFALAKPLLTTLAGSFMPGDRIYRVFVIDASYSMQHQPADRSLFEIARQQIIEQVEASGQGDGFSLVVLADPPRVVVGRAVFDAVAFRDEVTALAPLDGGADLAATLKAVEQLLEEVRREQPQLNSHAVTIYTDLGRTTWQAAVDASETGDGDDTPARQLARLAQRGTVEVVPLGRAGAENLAVTRLTLAEPFATVRQPVTLRAVAHHFGSEKLGPQELELLVDGRRVASKPVELLPGESSQPVTFQHTFDTPGEHRVEVRLADDALDVDNRRYLALPVAPHLNALVVGGKRGAAEPLAFALETDFQFNSRTIKPELVTEAALLERDLSRYDCIFLVNVAQFTAAEAQVLEKYLRAGGGLIFILGDAVLPDRYNAELAGSGPDAPRVLPARLGEAVRTEPLSFDPLDYRHPLVEVWKDQLNAGLLSARTWKHFPLEPLDAPDEASTAGRVALAFEGGDPAIVEARIGEGRSIVVATAASSASQIDAESGMFWSDIFRPERLAPISQELWRFAIASRVRQRNVLVGTPIGGRLPAAAPDARVEIIPPAPESASDDEPDATAAMRANTGPGGWSFDATHHSGIYQMRVAGGLSSEWFAVNVDPREADLARIDPRDLPERLVRASEELGVSGEPATVELQTAPPAVHVWMLVGVLGLLVTESLYAWWLGSRSG